MLERTKKTSKWLFSFPQKAFGINHIKQNNQLLRQQYGLLKAPVCPYCYTAIMELNKESPGVRKTYEVETEQGQQDMVSIDLYHWVCRNPECGADELLPEDKSEAKKWAKDMHNLFATEKIDSLPSEDFAAYEKTHIIYSRIFYFAALGCFIYLIYCIAFTNAPLFRTFLTYGCVITAFFVNGMRRSYRCWQLRNKILFQEGSFKKWLLEGKWFV